MVFGGAAIAVLRLFWSHDILLVMSEANVVNTDKGGSNGSSGPSRARIPRGWHIGPSLRALAVWLRRRMVSAKSTRRFLGNRLPRNRHANNIVRADSRLHYGPGASSRSEAPESPGDRAYKQPATQGSVMPTELVPPGEHLVLTFPGSRRERKRIYVEASDDITIYVTTPTGAQRFARGDEIRPIYDEAEDVPAFQETVVVPRRAAWCLLLVNRANGDEWDDARAVHYEVDD